MRVTVPQERANRLPFKAIPLHNAIILFRTRVCNTRNKIDTMILLIKIRKKEDCRDVLDKQIHEYKRDKNS